VFCAIDFAHPAFAEQRGNLVRTELCSDGEGHWTVANLYESSHDVNVTIESEAPARSCILFHHDSRKLLACVAQLHREKGLDSESFLKFDDRLDGLASGHGNDARVFGGYRFFGIDHLQKTWNEVEGVAGVFLHADLQVSRNQFEDSHL